VSDLIKYITVKNPDLYRHVIILCPHHPAKEIKAFQDMKGDWSITQSCGCKISIRREKSDVLFMIEETKQKVSDKPEL
jgi:hypothetical protein